MGKLRPADSIARNVSTTALSNIVSLDESPLLEGLIYVGTDDGLVQVTEDGGKHWRKVEQFPGVPQWTNITANLPDRHRAWSIIQDHENGHLLFLGTEFGVFASFDGGARWVHLKGGLPPIQVRDMTVQRREDDLVLATFGRGFYILDDYSPLRELTPEALTEDARLFPLRDALYFSQTGLAPAGTAGLGPLAGNWTAPNPPFGAVFTYSVGKALPADARLVLTITDDAGTQVRRLELDKAIGLRRVVWNLRGESPAAAGGRATQAGPQAAGAFAGFGRGPGARGHGRPLTAPRSVRSSATG